MHTAGRGLSCVEVQQSEAWMRLPHKHKIASCRPHCVGQRGRCRLSGVCEAGARVAKQWCLLGHLSRRHKKHGWKAWSIQEGRFHDRNQGTCMSINCILPVTSFLVPLSRLQYTRLSARLVSASIQSCMCWEWPDHLLPVPGGIQETARMTETPLVTNAVCKRSSESSM